MSAPPPPPPQGKPILIRVGSAPNAEGGGSSCELSKSRRWTSSNITLKVPPVAFASSLKMNKAQITLKQKIVLEHCCSVLEKSHIGDFRDFRVRARFGILVQCSTI